VEGENIDEHLDDFKEMFFQRFQGENERVLESKSNNVGKHQDNRLYNVLKDLKW
jgi:hypothetical protein